MLHVVLNIEYFMGSTKIYLCFEAYIANHLLNFSKLNRRNDMLLSVNINLYVIFTLDRFSFKYNL